MRYIRLLVVLTGLLLGFSAGGCNTASSKPGGPCADCQYGVVTGEKSATKRAFCVVDGKVINCDKNEKGCPGCALKY